MRNRLGSKSLNQCKMRLSSSMTSQILGIYFSNFFMILPLDPLEILIIFVNNSVFHISAHL